MNNIYIEESINEASSRTGKTYSADINGLMNAIDDLLASYDDVLDDLENIKQEFKDYEEYVEENYQPRKFNPYHEYGLSESDFH